MNVALLCVALLGLLLFTLGALVSGVRTGFLKEGSDPKTALEIRVRAHGNAAEYVPTFCVLILAGAWVWGAPPWFQGIAISAVVARYAHALGMHLAGAPRRRHPIKFAGAGLTYLSGLALALALAAGVIERWSTLR